MDDVRRDLLRRCARLADLEGRVRDARDERDAAFRAALAAGWSLRDVAEVAGVTHAAVRKATLRE